MRLAPLLLLLLLSPVMAAAQTLQVRQTSDGYLNLRDGPGTGHAILQRLSPGDRVTVLETLGRWARVRLASGKQGWASADYLERPPEGPQNVLFVDKTSDGYLNLRAGPGTNHPVLRRIYPGDRLVPLRTSGNWIAVRHATGAEGWVHSAYVSP